MTDNEMTAAIEANVQAALAEDLGGGDLTAQLVDADAHTKARLICRQSATICGLAWAEQCFKKLDNAVSARWVVQDGDQVTPDSLVGEIEGPARALLSGERAALNFLQTLSGTATRARHFANLVAGSPVRILDTRKTLPGLRLAQKYAVRVGGCHNHRLGLYDAFLIKENHILAAGGIAQAVSRARTISPSTPVEVEIESLEQLEEAIAAQCDRIMLDNFSLETMALAVQRTAGRTELEASGGLNDADVVRVAATGVDCISIGTLTKDLQSIDLSLRLIEP
ncbi:MAG: carboxylating nicotinate-nucleotide diphosphorylase [Pseudomonadota bacterium]|nr:carboxylating nicotinate-nucleotide diphosphorylase [Pseudomonadota bacterium]